MVRGITWSTAVAALLLAAIGGSGGPVLAVQPHNAGAEGWAWVVARHPSTTDYVPVAMDQGNSAAGTNTVHRASGGEYRVTFGGLMTGNVVVHVSPLTTLPRLCFVGNHGLQNSNYVVHVSCRNNYGSPVDTAFVINLLSQFSLSDDLAYVHAVPPSYTFASTYNSANGANSIQKTATGRWTVHFAGVGGAGGNGSLQVTAASGSGAVCRIVSWSPGILAKVACRQPAGAFANAGFMVSYMRGRGLKFEGDQNVAYLFADQPTVSSYSPANGFRYSSAAQLPVITRTATGVYSVRLPGMPLGGSAQVSAYGTDGNRCVVESIRKSGLPQRIGVRCFTAYGKQLADTRFLLHYAR